MSRQQCTLLIVTLVVILLGVVGAWLFFSPTEVIAPTPVSNVSDNPNS